MRIERKTGDGQGPIAVLDPIEARILGRSAEAIPGWMNEGRPGARGSLRWIGDSLGIEASFPDEPTMRAFVARFMPGLLPRLSPDAAIAA